jgi:hypothetical protein
MRAIRTVLPSALLLVSAVTWAAEAPRPAPQRDPVTSETPRPAPPRRPAPAPTYTPKEKISADSAVAFPVDI